MRVPGTAGAHLTYCTNIHPAESWPEVRANLERYVLAVRQRVAPTQRFGVGLRLSARAAEELSTPAALSELRDFLDEHALYVFTLNGFPYGDFHGTRIKENVYRPDWREDARLRYTNTLADLLAALLPEGGDFYGSVSTAPVAYRRGFSESDADGAIRHIVEHVVHLARVRERTGKLIVLALEPEPDCVLETSADTATFFANRLFAGAARATLARRLGVNDAEAEDTLRRHVGVCLDACHAAVEFEDPATAVADLHNAGIRVAKIQLSAGLRIEAPSARSLAALHAFADDVYLHQVVARNGHELIRHADLPEALAHSRAAGAALSDRAAGAALSDRAAGAALSERAAGAALSERAAGAALWARAGAGDEWRVHFHVPLHRERLGAFAGTQAFLSELIAIQRRANVSAHLEVETYTWSVLPREHRGADVVEDVARELEWVLDELRK